MPVKEDRKSGLQLELEEAQKRIMELEIERCELNDKISAIGPQEGAIAHEVYGWHPPKATKEQGIPDRWRYFFNDGVNWCYSEEFSFWSDNAYGEFVEERAIAAVQNAFGKGRKEIYEERIGPYLLDKHGRPTGIPSYSAFPPFDIGNRLTVTVKLTGLEPKEDV